MHNNIVFINNQHGECLERHEEVVKEFQDYFQDILREPLGCRNQAIQTIAQHIPKIINHDHNKRLLQPIIMQEVEDVMAQLKDGKAPSPDGFTTNFFHAFWEHIKKEV